MKIHKDSFQKIMIRKILIVDDDSDNLLLLKMILEIDKFEVQTAIDGQDAWESLIRNKPDIILSDLVMPRVNGNELLSWVSMSPEFRKIPTIIITGTPELLSENVAPFAIFRKPFQFKCLQTAISTAFHKSDRAFSD